MLKAPGTRKNGSGRSVGMGKWDAGKNSAEIRARKGAVLPAGAVAVFEEDGRLELSNNRAERSVKPFVIGRKNWLFANTPAGAQSSAVIYSLIETAKENKLDPHRYLLWVLQSAPMLSQADEFWAEKLLPANAPQECYISQ